MMKLQPNLKWSRITKLMFISILVFNSLSLFAQNESISIVEVKVDKQITELLKTWDTNIWFYTPKDNPVSSIEGLTREDFAIWDISLFQNLNDLFEVLEFDGTGGNLMGIGAYNKGINNPPIYITFEQYASDIENVKRVVFVEK